MDPHVSEYFTSQAASLNVSPLKTLRNLIASGWQATYSALFGADYVDALATHHIEAVQWHWDSRLMLLKGETPDYWAYFPIWPRGHMKSTSARRIAVVDAALAFAFGQPSYVLYLSRNSAMAQKHSISVESLLASPRVREYCPQLSDVKRGFFGQSKGWRQSFLNTQAGVYHFGGLDEGMAGGNVDDVRPTLIVLDDVDGRERSPVIAEKRFDTLTNEILPMRQSNTLSYYPQNFIDRYSVQYRIYSGQARVLTNRKPTEPIPAVIDPTFSQKTVNGIVKDIIVTGTPTWHRYDLKRCQEEIDAIGLEAFKRECLHMVTESKEGLVLHTYDDDVHVVSESEFAAAYGSASAWKTFYKVPFNDWARTKTEKHANVAGYIAIASQNSRLPGLSFIIPFSFGENSMPEDVATRLLSILRPYAYDTVTWSELIRHAHLRANAEQHFDTLAKRVEFERSHLKAIVPRYARPMLSEHNVRGGAMSHSEDTVRAIFNEIFGFGFIASNPGSTDSIEDVVSAFKVDYSEKHPFRDMQGYSRTFILAPDDEDAEPVIVNGVYVYPPRPYPKALQPHELEDSDLMRYQFSNFRYGPPVLTTAGEKIGIPLKINDDYFQALQMVYHKRLLTNIKLSQDEMAELYVNPRFRLENINARQLEGEDLSRARVTRQAQLTLPKILKGKKTAMSGLRRFKRS